MVDDCAAGIKLRVEQPLPVPEIETRPREVVLVYQTLSLNLLLFELRFSVVPPTPMTLLNEAGALTPYAESPEEAVTAIPIREAIS